jgi:hypothetical protein
VLLFYRPYDGADAGFDLADHTAVDPRLCQNGTPQRNPTLAYGRSSPVRTTRRARRVRAQR